MAGEQALRQAVAALAEDQQATIAGEAGFQVRSTAGAFELARQLSARGLDASTVEIVQVIANRLRLAIASPSVAGELEE